MNRREKIAKRNGNKLMGKVFGLLGTSILGLYLLNMPSKKVTQTVNETNQETYRLTYTEIPQSNSLPIKLYKNSLPATPKAAEEKHLHSKEKKTDVHEPQKKQIFDQGIVTCSNQNYMYAKLNLDILKKNNYPNAFLQDTKIGKETYYRTIVPTTSQDLESKLAELKKKNPFGTADDFFVVKGKEMVSMSQESAHDSQKRVKQMESAFKSSTQNMSKDKYIALMSPFIDKSYYLFNKGDRLDQIKIKNIADLIYEAGKEFKLPLVDYTALISNESKFTNKKGDIWSDNNYSEGYTQMRRETQKFVFDHMKKEGIKNLPDELPESIISNPELQFRMGAWYFNYCLKKSGWDGKIIIISDEMINSAINKYNMGVNTKKENPNYVKRVNGEKKKINQYLLPTT